MAFFILMLASCKTYSLCDFCMVFVFKGMRKSGIVRLLSIMDLLRVLIGGRLSSDVFVLISGSEVFLLFKDLPFFSV